MNMQDYAKSSTILVGPWGGQDGIHWDDGVYSAVRQVEIAHGAGIDSIRIEYDSKGTSLWSEIHGGLGGNKTDKVKLEYPNEFLTSVHGYYGSLNGWGPVMVRSLTFESNRKTYGPYGIEQGAYFSFPMIGGKIVGFHGRSGWFLDAIGVHLEPLHKPIPSNPMDQYSRSTYAVNEKFGYSMIQGGLDRSYDLIIAVKHKDDYGTNPLPNIFPKQTSGHQFAVKHRDDYSTIPQPNTLSNQTSGFRDQFHVMEPKKQIQAVSPHIIERVPSKNAKGVMTYGPWGGTGGTLFDDGVYDGIRQIKVSRNVGITSIKVCYDQKGEPVWGSKNGGTGSFKCDTIVFDFPSEILTHITGYHGTTMMMGPNALRSLTFHTTKTKHGPFGEEQGQLFSTNLREGRIVGFHGRKGMFVDAIGVHIVEGKVMPPISSATKFVPPIRPPLQKIAPPVSSSTKVVPPISSSIKPVPPINSSTKPSSQHDEASVNEAGAPKWSFKPGKKGLTEEAVQRVLTDPAPHGTGPWGGEGGKPWDDGVFTGIKQIILAISHAICSIEIEYDRNGQSVWSVLHGGNHGQAAQRVKLEYPHEVLTCISGYYGPLSKELGGVKVIKSLTFHTSRRKCGPFGEELGAYFTSATTEGKVVGFHGRSGMYLDAIGVHMQHWLGNQKSKPSSLMKIFS